MWWVFWLTLIVAGCGNSPNLPDLPPDGVVLAFGDSLTYGTGAGQEHGYPTALADMIGYRVINAGVPGETTAGGRQRLPKVLDEIRPALVILCLGGNDFLRKLPEDETRANLAAMIEEIQARGIPVVLVAVPKPRLIVREHGMYEALGERYGVPVLDDVLTEVLSDKALKSDPIHPNAKGYNRIAEALAQFLREAGALP